MKKIKLLTLTTLFILIFNICFTAFCAPQSDLDKKLNEKSNIQSDINKEKEKQNKAKKEKEAIDKNIKKLTGELDKISESLNELGDKKATILKELAEAEANEEKQSETLKKRLRVIYEDGATSYFSILMSSESIFDFFYNLEILRQISEHDDKILNELKETKEKIAVKKAELDEIIASEEAKQKELKTANASLKNESYKKQAYVKELDKNIEDLKKELDRVEREEAALRAEIARKAGSQSGSNVPKNYVGGDFLWPAPGVTTITSKFGYRVHPTTGQYKLHTGVDIACYTGHNVLAAADGVVVISGNHTAYGKYISINHGGGIVTLYAHNSQLLVSAGQSVKKGQVIAKSGNTGWSTGPHLHFEVIINGNPVNPMNYFN